MPGAGLVCAGLTAALSVALTGCDRVTPAPLAGPAYPSLRDVPPRPEPVDTVRQREEIAAGLIRDRADAGYTNQAIRYRTSLTEVPPLPAPLPAVVTPEPPPPVATTPEAIAVRPAEPAVLDDDDNLNDFLRRLVNRAEAVAPFESPDAVPGESPDAPAAAPPNPRPPEPAAGPEAAAEALPPLALFPARAEAEGDPGAGFLAWVGRKLRALTGTADPAPARPPHPALVPVAVADSEDLQRMRATAPGRGAAPAIAAPPAVPTLKPAVLPPAPAVPALKPAVSTGAEGGPAARAVTG